MQIFALNDIRSLEKSKGESNLLITLYAHSFDPLKENIITTLAQLIGEQQHYN